MCGEREDRSNRWVITAFGAISIALAYVLAPTVARIRAVERLLSQAFGAEYDAYRARTRSRLLPGFY